MIKQEWKDRKNFCMDNAEVVQQEDKRLADEYGTQYVPYIVRYIPPVPTNYIFITESEVVGDTCNWRINSVIEYLVVDGTKIFEADCTEVI